MKLAFFDFYFDPARPGISGLSDTIWEMGRAFAALGDDVHIIGPYAKGTVAPAGTTLHRFDLPPINYSNVIGHMLICLRGWYFLKKTVGDADLIHTPEYLSSAIFARCGSLPVVVTTPGNIYERIDSQNNPFDPFTTFIYKFAANISARQCAAINSISDSMKMWWVKTGAPPEKVVTIHYGIDTSAFYPIPDAHKAVSWDATLANVLYIGRLSKEKGVDLLLKAWSNLGVAFPDALLHIVGDGPQRQELETLATQLGLQTRVIFYGWRDKHTLPALYTASFCCVMPSLSEPLGRVALESMACGTPVIGANVGGIPEIVKHQTTGLLFERGDVDGLTGQLRTLLDSPALRDAYGERALRYVQETQSWAAVCQRIKDEIYVPVVKVKQP